MSKLAAGALVAVMGFVSLGLHFNACNDPILQSHVVFCGSNAMQVDYAANGGSRNSYSYKFTVYRVQPGLPDLKVGQAEGPGLPKKQRYVVNVPIQGPSGSYGNDSWPADTLFYLTINSSGPGNHTEPQSCAQHAEP